MTPGGPAVCDGTVFHRRLRPSVHAFEEAVSYVWLDPDRPDELCAAHPLWSSTRPAPARFRRRDYGMSPRGSLSGSVRDDLATVLEERPTGPVRMLTQVRRWGWLFNPITVYVVWPDDGAVDRPGAKDADFDPVGVVLEVTNTPWKERLRYPLALGREGDWHVAAVDKELHVSPFLDEGYRYELRFRADGPRIDLGLDVVPHGGGEPVLRTRLHVERAPATRAVLGGALRSQIAPTHRVSLGIHREALRLWLKRVPFVAHPRKRAASA